MGQTGEPLDFDGGVLREEVSVTFFYFNLCWFFREEVNAKRWGCGFKWRYHFYLTRYLYSLSVPL